MDALDLPWNRPGPPGQPRHYSGVGSRRVVDPVVLNLMTLIARALARRGWRLRSGAAAGPDTAFESGAPASLRDIYVPNASFGNRPRGGVIVPKDVNLMTWLKAGLIAERFHGMGRRMPQDVRDLMARNVYQVLGDDLKTPSEFLVCDAPGAVFDDQGRVVDVDGGTGMAVRLAAAHGIPVFHLGVPAHREALEALCEAPEPAGAGDWRPGPGPTRR